MRIDAHQHFMKYNPAEYPWVSDENHMLKSVFMPDDLYPIMKNANMDGTIAVQARQSIEETEWLLDLADQYDWIKGVVGWLDICSPDFENQLQKYINLPKLKGIRHVIHDEPDDSFMLSDRFLRGMDILQNYDLTYDLLIFERHLPQTIQLVKQFPNQKFVIDHIGKPLMNTKEPSAFWKEHIEELAGFNNVYCKISGLVTEPKYENWRAEDFTPYLDILFTLFRPNRLMIGSDWPVCTVRSDYQSVMSIVTNYISSFTAEEKEYVLGRSCAEFYGLESAFF
ncbi:amidohydrolase family protein [Bacillus sp. JJ1533]|uniref:amidohydrolase family protein n=1 Tax=Bacillus sp. JJ1533 TaxID=3122959 RepID=UPI00300084DA